MKTLLSALLALAASAVPASAITVTTPANNAQVTSPFNLVASTSTCGGVSAVSMGYSIDSNLATIEPTSFSVKVTASSGPHILHVKCWGQQTNSETLLNITVGQAPATAGITVTTPASGAQVTSPFKLAASASTCGGVSAVSMGYSIDSGSVAIEPTSFSAMVTASSGPHILHVKCWGQQTNGETNLNITVGQAPATAGITVTTPASGAQVTSPFKLVASASTCGGVSAVSMGYSIDSGSVAIEPTSFSASVPSTSGAHTLHVKCWGQGAAEQVLLPINVSSSSGAATPQFSLASGQYASKQIVSLSDSTAGAAIYYTTDGSGPSTSSPKYSTPIPVASSMVIEALAASPGLANSGLARASYVIAQKSGPIIPANAVEKSAVQLLPNWKIVHDPATGGTASGVMTLVSDPSLSGQAERFDTTFTNYGGILYSVTYGNDPASLNFVYDAEVWIEQGSKIGNLEMDNNQVIADGDTVIYGFQCAGDSNTWDYTENVGTRANPVDKWVQSNQSCNPASWTTNTWHHVEISYSRDDVGNVTYHSVWLDGVEAPINQTVMSAFSLNWAAGVLISNFQVDGTSSSGSSTLYLDDFNIYRW